MRATLPINPYAHIYDLCINIGLLTPTKLRAQSTQLHYYDPKGELLVRRRMIKRDVVYYVYRLGRDQAALAESDDVVFSEDITLLVVRISRKLVHVDRYVSGVWEVRLAKLAEDTRNGSKTITRPPRPTPLDPKS